MDFVCLSLFLFECVVYVVRKVVNVGCVVLKKKCVSYASLYAVRMRELCLCVCCVCYVSLCAVCSVSYVSVCPFVCCVCCLFVCCVYA